MNRTSVLVIGAILVVAISGLLFKVFNPGKSNANLPGNNLVVPGTVPGSSINVSTTSTTSITITGVIGCLPHKDLKGPQTMECAMGLRDSAGRYFFLNYDYAEKNNGFIPVGTAVEVTGKLAASDNSRYQAEGVILVSTIEKIMPAENPAIKKTESGISGIGGVVWLGPVCPVEKTPPDPSCASRPYQTSLVVATVDGDEVVAKFLSDADGSFKVNVLPGQYIIRYSDLTKKYPICGTSDIITVEKGALTTVNVYCDTGIR